MPFNNSQMQKLWRISLYKRIKISCSGRLKIPSLVKEAKKLQQNVKEELPQHLESIQPAGPQNLWNEKAQSKIHIFTTVPQMNNKLDVTQICRGTFFGDAIEQVSQEA